MMLPALSHAEMATNQISETTVDLQNILCGALGKSQPKSLNVTYKLEITPPAFGRQRASAAWSKVQPEQAGEFEPQRSSKLYGKFSETGNPHILMFDMHEEQSKTKGSLAHFETNKGLRVRKGNLPYKTRTL